ncbi:MAG TPA: IPT/TIG domain-containing protein [Bryobacteraceae bacterium]|nr:IPT/TIG domain-containing protein [Bryobacteraceae bacterium]
MNSYRFVCLPIAIALAPWAGRAQAPQFTISTIVGNGTAGYAGDGGPASQAELNQPCKIALDSSGSLYIADQNNQRVRKVSGGTITTIAGNGTAGYSGDTGPATSANINLPCGVALDQSGNLFFSQTGGTDSAIRKVDTSGKITTIAGTTLGAGYSGDGAAATNAQVNGPTGLAFDSANNLYIADTANNRIRKIDSDGGGNIVTWVGNGVAQYAGDGKLAWQSSINSPNGVAADAAGNLYVADTANHCIRKVSGNVVSTFAGICGVTGGFSGDGGPATKAQLYYPKDVAVDPAGNVYIADTYNFRIRMVTPGGIIYTIAGKARSGYAGDGGLATNALLNFPDGVAVGPGGIIYISDQQNNVIRQLTPGNVTGQGPPPIITSMNSASFCGAYAGVAAPGGWVEIHGTSLAADTRQWASSDFNGVNAPTSLDGSTVTIGGEAAVLNYISPTQINAQVPVDIAPGPQPVSVKAPNGVSPAVNLTVNDVAPGLCFSYTVNGNQYAAAVISGTSTYVLPANAAIGGISYRPAHPGETISLFGTGFGATTPLPPQGQIVQQQDTINPLPLVFFGPVQAQVTYAGFAPGYVGLYQINVVVPNIPADDAVPITFAQGQFAAAPTLYTSVQ